MSDLNVRAGQVQERGGAGEEDQGGARQMRSRKEGAPAHNIPSHITWQATVEEAGKLVNHLHAVIFGSDGLSRSLCWNHE